MIISGIIISPALVKSQTQVISKAAVRSAAPVADYLGSTESTLHHVDCPKQIAKHTLPVRPHADFEQICKQLKSESLPVKRFKLSDYCTPLDDGHDALAEFCGLQQAPAKSEEPLPCITDAIPVSEPCVKLPARQESPRLAVQIDPSELDNMLIPHLAASEGPLVSGVSAVSEPIFKAKPARKRPVLRRAVEDTKVDQLYALYEDFDGTLDSEWHCESHSPLWCSEATLAEDKALERSRARTTEGPRRPLPACAIRPTGYRSTGEMRVARNLNFGARARLDEYVNEKKPELKAPHGVPSRKCPLVLDPREAHPSRTFGVIPSVNLQIT